MDSTRDEQNARLLAAVEAAKRWEERDEWRYWRNASDENARRWVRRSTVSRGAQPSRAAPHGGSRRRIRPRPAPLPPLRPEARVSDDGGPERVVLRWLDDILGPGDEARQRFAALARQFGRRL